MTTPFGVVLCRNQRYLKCIVDHTIGSFPQDATTKCSVPNGRGNGPTAFCEIKNPIGKLIPFQFPIIDVVSVLFELKVWVLEP